MLPVPSGHYGHAARTRHPCTPRCQMRPPPGCSSSDDRAAHGSSSCPWAWGRFQKVGGAKPKEDGTQKNLHRLGVCENYLGLALLSSSPPIVPTHSPVRRHTPTTSRHPVLPKAQKGGSVVAGHPSTSARERGKGRHKAEGSQGSARSRARCEGAQPRMAQNQIQYSEKYFDDIYEYRCARRRAAAFSCPCLPLPEQSIEPRPGPPPPDPRAPNTHTTAPPQARGAAPRDCAAPAQGPPLVRGETGGSGRPAPAARASAAAAALRPCVPVPVTHVLMPPTCPPWLLCESHCRTNGARWACSSHAAGCTTPSTGQSRTSCSSGERPARGGGDTGWGERVRACGRWWAEAWWRHARTGRGVGPCTGRDAPPHHGLVRLRAVESCRCTCWRGVTGRSAQPSSAQRPSRQAPLTQGLCPSGRAAAQHAWHAADPCGPSLNFKRAHIALSRSA